MNEANFFILKSVLEKIVLNLHSPVLNKIRLLDIGQKKPLLLPYFKDRLPNNDLFKISVSIAL